MKIDINFSVTEPAAKHLLDALGDGSMIRISAKSGCSGMAYGLGVVDKDDVSSLDFVEEISGVVFVADKKSAINLDEVVLDWISQEGVEGFKFVKPESSGGSCRRGGCCSS